MGTMTFWIWSSEKWQFGLIIEIQYLKQNFFETDSCLLALSIIIILLLYYYYIIIILLLYYYYIIIILLLYYYYIIIIVQPSPKSKVKVWIGITLHNRKI